MTTTKTSLRRLVAGAGALALGMAGTFALGTTASAQELGPDQPGAPTEGTLTINKYSGAPVGEGNTPDPENLLDGVEFTVTQVGRTIDGDCVAVDLTDASHWDGLDGLFDSAPNEPAGPFCLLGVPQVDETEDGQVVFNLDVGVYFVQETDPGDNPIVSAVPDFYVAIPTSLGDAGEGWNYNVVADPKNQIMEGPEKTIEDQLDMVIGADVTWTLTVPIPSLNNDDVFESASITDVLDARLRYESSTLTIGDTELVENTHYSVDADGVTWTFLDAGLDLLFENQGADITVTLVTTVLEVGDGSIPNDDYSSEFNDATVPGEQVPYTYWGELSIFKHDDSGSTAAESLPLAGAEFQVFLPVGDQCLAIDDMGEAIATGTSNDEGRVMWNVGAEVADVLGLWVNSSEDGPLEEDAQEKLYCVYETVVPAGHSAVLDAHDVTVTAGEVAEGEYVLTVENPRTEGPELPLTGGAGTIALMSGGALLFGAGLVVMVVARRRRIMAA